MLDLGINEHAAHSTATFLELSFALSALSLRALNAINHTCGDADKTTQEVLAARDGNIKKNLQCIQDAVGFKNTLKHILLLVWSLVTTTPRKRLALFAKIVLSIAAILLLLVGTVPFDKVPYFGWDFTSNGVFFTLALLLCLWSTYVAYHADSTKIKAEVANHGAASFTAQFAGSHSLTSELTED